MQGKKRSNSIGDDNTADNDSGKVSCPRHEGQNSAKDMNAVKHEDDPMGPFEDPFEDEYSSGDDDDNDDMGEESAAMDIDNDTNADEHVQPEEDLLAGEAAKPSAKQDTKKSNVKVYLPGQKLAKDEVLDCDWSTYQMLHTLNAEWPCLSFDWLHDGSSESSGYPLTMYSAAGTQADKALNNKILIMKMSRLRKNQKQHLDIDSDEEDESDDDEVDEDPILEYRSIRHFGGVNRLRTMPNKEKNIIATWSDAGKTQIFDVTDVCKSLSEPGHSYNPVQASHTNIKHKTEGYALDWSTLATGSLLSGDCKSEIYLTTMDDASSWQTESKPFKGHTDSVEDLQWSPTQAHVFASASVDKTIKLWDSRDAARSPKLSIVAHTTDVNVISWNKKVPWLLASGADDGSFSIWDMRMWQKTPEPSPSVHFQWHKSAITAIEWHPNDNSMLSVAGADDQLTIWDLSMEPDPEALKLGQEESDIPPQLMFIHQGQNHIKEFHWHPKYNGVVMSTAMNGFNIFKTINSEGSDARK